MNYAHFPSCRNCFSATLTFVHFICVLGISFCLFGITAACTIQEGERKVRADNIISRNSYNTGRLTARPNNTIAKDEFTAGVQPLNLDNRRDGFIYVPTAYNPNKLAALALMLHGAGGQAEHGLSLLRQYADDNNLILVAPASRAASWDIISGNSFGTDVIFIDQTLNLVFERFNIDSKHLAIGGFSDGASYALCLGLTNGDLFTHVIAFSPGFAYALENKGKPAVFISHGTQDRVLPIDPCSRRIVPQLQRQGLKVNYQEFNGGHEIPGNISGIGVEWFRHNNLK